MTSGRSMRPSSSVVVGCSTKSQCSTIPAQLDHAAELDLAPAPADVRRAQRGDEVPRLGAEPLLIGAQLADALGQRPVCLLAHALDALELGVHPLERVLQRPHVPGDA